MNSPFRIKEAAEIFTNKPNCLQCISCQKNAWFAGEPGYRFICPHCGLLQVIHKDKQP